MGDSNGKNGECQLKINERKWKREEELTFRRSVLSHFDRERYLEVRELICGCGERRRENKSASGEERREKAGKKGWKKFGSSLSV